MTQAVVEATRESFHEEVAEGLVLVDVWGPQCRPCISLMPHVDRLAEESDGLKVVKLEAPKARRVCMEYKVMGLPTFLLLRDGQEIARLSDPNLQPEKLKTWLKEVMPLAEERG